ncbi:MULTISPECIES: hypothetical protein [Bacillus]|uniref:hypothetical protein n=1 Tax=Bacillus TaxID=1386 RepID=UPI001ABDC292|nr:MULTISPECIES: hypothetical protein [Bacillus]MCH4866808.1 hypothetical protein [Bacillus sp. 1006-3]QTG87304.1 hypothetical protein J4048_20475 [Bacillus amyloliquefaciens]
MRITKIPLDWFYRKDPDWVKYREGFQQYGYEEVVIDSRSEYRRTGGRVLSIYNKKVKSPSLGKIAANAQVMLLESLEDSDDIAVLLEINIFEGIIKDIVGSLDKVPIIIPIFPVDIEEVELEACDWLAEAALERVLNDYRSIDD